jgi:hypothetical protein
MKMNNRMLLFNLYQCEPPLATDSLVLSFNGRNTTFFSASFRFESATWSSLSPELEFGTLFLFRGINTGDERHHH